MPCRRASALLAALAFATAAGPSRADFYAGLDAYRRGDFATALAEWRPLAEDGDAAAAANLGVMYLKGDGVEQDPVQAARWLSLAAEKGNPIAQDNLGQMYYMGEGVPKDLEAAARWIKAAAFQGDPSAQLRLGTLYAKGIGVERDPERALLWWKKSAEQGNAAARARIAVAEGRDHVSEHFTPQPAPSGAGPSLEPASPQPPAPVVASPPSEPPAPIVASPPPEPPAPVASAARPGFLVQVASVRSEEDVRPEWSRLQRRHRDLLGDLALDVEARDLGTRTVYRLRVGPPRNRASAEELCEELKRQRLSCLVREVP